MRGSESKKMGRHGHIQKGQYPVPPPRGNDVSSSVRALCNDDNLISLLNLRGKSILVLGSNTGETIGLWGI